MAKAKKLPSGNWRVLVFVGYDDQGKRQYRSFTSYDRRKAEQEAAAFAAERRFENKHNKIKLGAAIDRYIAAKSNVLSPATIKEYKTIRNTKIQGLMDAWVDELTQEQIQKAINEEAMRLAHKTVKNIYYLLTPVLKVFRPNFNPTITLPPKVKVEFKIPTEDEIQQIFPFVKGTVMELPFLLASQLGLREGEIAALQPHCVNRAERQIIVKQDMVRNENGQLVLKTPKTYAGFRTLNCDEYIINLIDPGLEPDAFIVGMSPNAISQRWVHVLKRANIPHFKFHALRHYFASQALLQGIPQKYIAEMMGHSSTDFLDKIYQHTYPSHKQAFAFQMTAKTRELLQHEMQHTEQNKQP